jgi:glycosyltransferase involved in cell wall biosynthesis
MSGPQAPAQARKLKIGMVAPPWFEVPPRAYGGIEGICASLVDGLTARGHSVTLIGVGSNGTNSQSFLRTFSEPPSGRLGEALPELIHAAAANSALAELDLDLVHDHSLAGPLTAGGRALPTIVTTHGPVEGEFGAYYVYLPSNVRFVAISDAQRRLAPGLKWVGRVYNAISVDDYPFQAEKDDIAVFLGRMHPTKGAHLAIKVAREAGLPLILAGKCTEPIEKHYFENEVEPLLGPDIEWAGQLETEPKKEMLAKARCLLFPILWNEPFGIVLCEAMACGTPVVALDGGSVEEIVIDGVTGFICRSESELVNAIKSVGEIDPAKCREQASHFDVDTMVEGYESIYLSETQN